MRFADFLRTTVLISAAAASALAAVTLAAAFSGGDNLVVLVAVGWWLLAGMIGLWLARRGGTSPAIASLLASARTQASLPDVNPSLTILNRLWPLLIYTIVTGAAGVTLPQVSAIAVGFPIIGAMAWRRQAAAVSAIEDRDGARFYIERTSPLRPIRLVRTPGFRSNLMELNGASGRSSLRRRA